MKKIVLILILMFAYSSYLYARPQYSLLQSFGMKCQTCHINTQGGGERNNMGWTSRKDISLFGGAPSFFPQSNSFINDIFTAGVDFRYQSYRRNGEAKRVNLIMQLTPYLSIKPAEWLEFEGQYNIAYNILKEGKYRRYAGQQPFAGSVNINPFDKVRFRIGYFQPTIGTKYDDHTLLIRRFSDGGYSMPLIPDDLAELGVQVDYEKYDWLGLSLGFFDSKNLASSAFVTNAKASDDQIKSGMIIKESLTDPIVDKNTISMALKATIYPNLNFHNMSTFFGGTFYTNSRLKGLNIGNNYFHIASLFWHTGITDRLAIMLEYMWSTKQNKRITNNYLAEVTYQIMEPINVFVRAERGNTLNIFYNYDAPVAQYEQTSYHVNQFVFGSHIFVLPFVDLLPEFRIQNREDVPGYYSQWAFQIHLFY